MGFKKTERINGKRKRIKKFPGYPAYPPSEDLYTNSRETDINTDNPYEMKTPNEDVNTPNEKDYLLTGDDLDVPGAELDDESELVGSEDEENNYYSISDNR